MKKYANGGCIDKWSLKDQDWYKKSVEDIKKTLIDNQLTYQQADAVLQGVNESLSEQIKSTLVRY